MTKFLHKDIACDKADKGEQKTEKETTLQHDGLSDSTEATKFSLASLLTSSDCGTSHTIAPLSSSSEITTALLTDAKQSLHQNFKPPLTTTTLLTHKMALGSNFNGQNIETSLHLKDSNGQQAIIGTDTDLSADTKSESRINISLHTSDSSSSGTGITSSAVKSNFEVSKAEPTSECDSACAPDTDSSASTSITRTVGLMDLLTTAVEDRNSSVVSDTLEDKWIAPHVKEVRVSPLLYRATTPCLSYADTVCKKISKATTSR